MWWRQVLLGQKRASKGHVASIQGEVMENGVSPHPWSCQSSLVPQLSIKTLTPSSPRRWCHHQMRANVQDPGCCVQGKGGCISSLSDIWLFVVATSSIQWIISPRVLCLVCGLSTHLCAIMTKSTQTKSIYPFFKVLRMWEIISEGGELADEPRLSITHDKVLK
jgi:hypothetical protein